MRTLKLALFVIVTACASAFAAPIYYYADLGNFENPATGSAGTGLALISIDTVAHLLTVDVTFAGLGSGVTAAHIHCCVAAPGNVGVATTTPTFPGFPSGVTSGSYSNTFNLTLASSFRAGFITANGGTPASAEAALGLGLANGEAYFNIHTTAFPGGEIRGFLVPVPEPATYALTGIALVGIAIGRRRRSRLN